MKSLHTFCSFLVVSIFMYACSSFPIKNEVSAKEKPVVIANDSLEYEVIIFDIGFNLYLKTIARPIGYYSQNFLENKNYIYVTNWNIRAMNPSIYDVSIYGSIIDYDPKINYGLEVNYKLFNYFQFAQQKYNIRLDGTGGSLERLR
ncbi:MAG: Uncharacterised protein [Flavobacterium sp. SCGC AAA160-P02]|nr:MAG: Uncharacterised protein [Flavobacterium sp. SCGC AAA160-P02]